MGQKKMIGTNLVCMDCGHKADLLAERFFRCKECGGLYDVIHNYSSLRNFNTLKELFDRRARTLFEPHRNPKSYLYTSGIWRFKELIMPNLSDEHIITLGEGNFPIIPAGEHLRKWIGGDIDLRIIYEGALPTWSFKDAGGTVMVSVAKAAGIKRIGCASTGDTSAMAAAYASAAGMECVVILPDAEGSRVTPAQMAQPLVHGARVILVPGNFDIAMRVAGELYAEGVLFPANSVNPTRIEGHQATVFQIAQHLGWTLPDWIVAPVGNGSNVSSIGKGLLTLRKVGYHGKSSRILGCQSRAACSLARSWLLSQIAQETDCNTQWATMFRSTSKAVGRTTATAALIGNPVSAPKVMREIFDSQGAMKITPEKMLNEAVAICGMDGLFICPQTGIALGGIKRAVHDKTIKPGSTVFAVATAAGLKFTESAAEGLVGNIVRAPDSNLSTLARIIEQG